MEHLEKGKIEMELTNVKVMIIQYLHTFFGGDLQMVYRDLLRLACQQKKLALSKSTIVLLDC